MYDSRKFARLFSGFFCLHCAFLPNWSRYLVLFAADVSVECDSACSDTKVSAVSPCTEVKPAASAARQAASQAARQPGSQAARQALSSHDAVRQRPPAGASARIVFFFLRFVLSGV